MKNGDFKFTFKNEEGKEIECEMILSFYVREKDKNYMLFTDNTYDEENNLNVYAYYNTSNDETMIPITETNEFNMINHMYQNVVKKVQEDE